MTEDEPYEIRVRRKMIEIFGPFDRFHAQMIVPSQNMAGSSPFPQKEATSRSNSPTTFLMLQNMAGLVEKSPIQPPVAPKIIQKTIENETPIIRSPKPPKSVQSIENQKLAKVQKDLDEPPKVKNEILKETNLQKSDKKVKMNSSHSKRNSSKEGQEMVSTEKILEVLTFVPPMLSPPRPAFLNLLNKVSPKQPIQKSTNLPKKEESVPIKEEKTEKVTPQEMKKEAKEKLKEEKKEKGLGGEGTSSIKPSPFITPSSDKKPIPRRNGEKRPLREENSIASIPQIDKKRKATSDSIGNLNLMLLEKNQLQMIEATMKRKGEKGGMEGVKRPSSSIPSTTHALTSTPSISSTPLPPSKPPSQIPLPVNAVDENGIQDMDISESSSEKDEDESKKQTTLQKPIPIRKVENPVEKTIPKKENKPKKPKMPEKECCAHQCIPSQAVDPEKAQSGMSAEEFYSKRARDIKHNGDAQLNGNKVERMLLYLECIAYYVMAARHCQTDEHRHSLLRSTSDFVRTISKNSLTLPFHFQDRIAHLLKRVEAVQLYQLYTTRSTGALRNLKIVQQLEKSVDEKPNDTSTNENSPATAIAPSDSREVTISRTHYTLYKQQLKISSFLMSAHEIWESSKRDNSEAVSHFQTTVEGVTGHRVELDMRLEALARVVLTATSWLRSERKKEEMNETSSRPKKDKDSQR